MAKSQKIALVGTSCSGKTTLLEALKLKYKANRDIVFVEEAARIYFMQNTSLPARFETKVQKGIMQLALQNEKKAQKMGKIIISDRSVMDSVAYAMHYGDKKGAEFLFDTFSHWVPTYTHLFLLDPLNIPYVKDDIRTESEEERAQIHKIFLKLFDSKKIQYKLLSGTVEERVIKIEKILE